MDKLLCHWGYAKSYDENRRTPTNKIKSDIVETMESTKWKISLVKKIRSQP